MFIHGLYFNFEPSEIKVFVAIVHYGQLVNELS